MRKIILLMFPHLEFFLFSLGNANSPLSVAAPCQKDTASVCSNKLPDNVCEFFFQAPQNSSEGSLIDSNCTRSEYQDLAIQCRRTCMSCCNDPAYQCDNKRGTRLNCTKIAESGGCETDIPWMAIMLQQECPRSCGLCMDVSCKDNDDNCPLLSNICEHKDWYQYMEEICPRTCNTCNKVGQQTTTAISSTARYEVLLTTRLNTTNTEDCVDVAMNCAENINFCYVVEFEKIMRQKCKKTCNFCDNAVATFNADCRDFISSCGLWAAGGFCADPGYTAEQKQVYCRRSCGYC